MTMYIFENLGMCHNTDGIAPGFAVRAGGGARYVNATGCCQEKNAQDFSASEILMIAMIAKQLLEARN